MTHSRFTRFVTAVVALTFGLAMAGPETPACNHHQDQPRHHHGTQSTAPQACCPAAIGGSVASPTATWSAAPLPVLVVDVEASRPLLLPSRKHLLPFALAPPRL